MSSFFRKNFHIAKKRKVAMPFLISPQVNEGKEMGKKPAIAVVKFILRFCRKRGADSDQASGREPRLIRGMKFQLTARDL
jgi:hypothetical protein